MQLLYEHLLKDSTFSSTEISFKEELKQARVFYFPDINKSFEYRDQINPRSARELFEIMPFDICYFETSDNEGTFLGILLEHCHKDVVNGLFFASHENYGHRVKAGGFAFNLIENKVIMQGTAQDKEFFYENVKCSMESFLAQLHSKDTILGKPRSKVRIRRGRKDKPRIRDIVLVVGTKRVRPDKIQGIPIEYSHRFEVRGHWRRIKRIGKDRQGEYNQVGRTWVKAFEKGQGELVKKKRVLIPDP